MCRVVFPRDADELFIILNEPFGGHCARNPSGEEGIHLQLASYLDCAHGLDGSVILSGNASGSSEVL